MASSLHPCGTCGVPIRFYPHNVMPEFIQCETCKAADARNAAIEGHEAEKAARAKSRG